MLTWTWRLDTETRAGVSRKRRKSCLGWGRLQALQSLGQLAIQGIGQQGQHQVQVHRHGDQEGSAYNAYFERMCYHPLFLFNQLGDLERAMLRRGNHNSAKFWRRVLLPVIDRYRDRDIPKYFRGDAAFAIPALYRVLEEQSFQYTIRIPANKVLMASISYLLGEKKGSGYFFSVLSGRFSLQLTKK